MLPDYESDFHSIPQLVINDQYRERFTSIPLVRIPLRTSTFLISPTGHILTGLVSLDKIERPMHTLRWTIEQQERGRILADRYSRRRFIVPM